jgi:hypothetical protein
MEKRQTKRAEEQGIGTVKLLQGLRFPEPAYPVRMQLSGSRWKFELRYLTPSDIHVHDSKIQCRHAAG